MALLKFRGLLVVVVVVEGGGGLDYSVYMNK